MIPILDTAYLGIDEHQQDFESWDFPGGERGLRFTREYAVSGRLNARINSPSQLVDLVLATNALKNHKGIPEKLVLGYFPYARQDRVSVPGEALSVQAIASIIDNLGYKKICILDPHSNVLAACFSKTRVEMVSGKYFCNIYINIAVRKEANAKIGLVAPDAGAVARTLDMATITGFPVFYGTKHRDPATGKLSGFAITNPADIDKITDLVIIDDICDGGGTFSGLAKEIKYLNPSVRLHLWVTHGIFSGNAKKALSVFESVGCTDSWQSQKALNNCGVNPTVISYWN